MAPWRRLNGLLRGRFQRWERPIPQSDQFLRIVPSVLRHIRRHRQASFAAREAGGQLFGRLTPELVLVSHVSGPYARDERGRYTFRSNPQAAQMAIERFARRGLLYLGEWHTHAEDVPRPSADDDQALRQIFARSQRNSSALLLVILGLGKPDIDIGVWYLDASGHLCAIS